MTELDALAPCSPGVWTHENVTVSCDTESEIDFVRTGATLTVRHRTSSSEIGERLVAAVTESARELNLTQREFELVMVGLVRSTIADPVEAWTTYYRNSLDELICGRADFAPIHERAEQLAHGSVLDLGSCFGFFPLRLALRGHDVIATDLSAGTMRLLDTVAPHLGTTVRTQTCDAADVPLPDGSVDTVTALHLLEHVDADTGSRIVDEALRLARNRVVVAVPFETETTTCHGHVRTFDLDSLRELGASTGRRFEVSEHHGGWLVIDTAAASLQLV